MRRPAALPASFNRSVENLPVDFAVAKIGRLLQKCASHARLLLVDFLARAVALQCVSSAVISNRAAREQFDGRRPIRTDRPTATRHATRGNEGLPWPNAWFCCCTRMESRRTLPPACPLAKDTDGMYHDNTKVSPTTTGVRSPIRISRCERDDGVQVGLTR